MSEARSAERSSGWNENAPSSGDAYAHRAHVDDASFGVTLQRMREVLRIVPTRRAAREAPSDVRACVVRSVLDAERLRGLTPDRVQLATHGWGRDQGALSYLLDAILTPMLVDGARLELVH